MEDFESGWVPELSVSTLSIPLASLLESEFDLGRDISPLLSALRFACLHLGKGRPNECALERSFSLALAFSADAQLTRTHIASRMCGNAPASHKTRYSDLLRVAAELFKRVGTGGFVAAV
jgi:hypothetical protein